MRLRELGGGEVSVEAVVGESRDLPEGIGDGEGVELVNQVKDVPHYGALGRRRLDFACPGRTP
jgi:hypothetical protein